MCAQYQFKTPCTVDGFNYFHSLTCDIISIVSLFTAKRNSKVTLVVNFIPNKFWNLTQGVSKVILHTDLNIYRNRSRGSRFVISSVLVCYKCSQTSSISSTNLIYLLTSIKAYPIPIQNNMHCWWTELNKRKP